MVPAVAVNVPTMAPAATVTEAGTVKFALLLVSVTTSPPAGAVAESVTVQVDVPLLDRIAGVHASELTRAFGTRDNASACELPL